MAAPSDGPCEPWVTWDQVGAVCDPPALPGDSDAQAALQDMIIAAVSRELWRKTCSQYGLCEVTIRPLACCRHGRHTCACGHYPYVLLGDQPIAEVTEVRIDGAVFDPENYRVDEFTRLVRLDGSQWPRCNDLVAANTEPGTFEVDETFGLGVPPDGVLAAALLCCRWAEEIAAGDCEAPDNATQLQRDGVTIEIRPPTMSTGNRLVDEWLQSFQCGHGAMFDPGARRSHVVMPTP